MDLLSKKGSFARLTTFYLVLFIFTILVGAYAISIVRASLLSEAGKHLATAAADTAHDLDLLMAERYGDVQILSLSLRDHMQHPRYLSDYLERTQELHPVYLWLGVTDAQGLVVAATNPGSVGKDRSQAPWFRAIRDKGLVGDQGVAVGDAEPSEESDGVLAVSFTAPLVGQRGEFLGVVSTRLGLPVLEDVTARTVAILQTQLGTGITTEYQFTNRRGDLIADSLLREEGMVNLDRLGLASMALMASGLESYVEEKHERRQVEVLSGYARTKGAGDFSGLDWGVLVRMDRNEFLAPIDRVITRVLVTGILLVAPLWGFILWTGRILERERRQVVMTNTALAGLVQASRQITAESDPDSLLQTLTETARSLTGATGAALEILDKGQRDLTQVLYAGSVSGEVIKRVNEGLAVAPGVPLRSVMSLPVMKSGQLYGRLHLVGKQGTRPTPAEFTELDEMVLDALLAQASVVIEHASALRNLQISESRYRGLLLESTGEGIIGVDLDGRCVFINKVGTALLGYQPEEVRGRILHEIVSHHFPDGSPYSIEGCPLTRTLRIGESCRLDDEVFWRRDGTAFAVEYSTHPITEDEHITGAVVVFHDISERKRAESRVVELLERYENLVSSLDAVIWEADPTDLRVTYVSRQFERWVGYTAQQWLTNEITWQDLIHPDDVGRVLAERVAEVQARRNHILDYRLRTADGRVLWVEDVGTVIEQEGRPVKLCGVLLDVTERRQTQDSLERSQAQLAAIIGSAMDAIVTMDADQRITLFNAAAEEMFRCPAAQALGQPIDRFIPERFRRTHREHIRAYGESNQTTRTMNRLGTVVGLRADNAEFPIEAAISQTQTAAGKCYTVILRDISERITIEEQLRQAQKMEGVGRLAGGIAHDFNNMLTVITGYCQLLLDQRKADDPAQKSLAQIKTAGERAGALTHQLLAFSRKQMLAPKVLDLNALVANLEGMLRRLIGEDIDLRIVADPAAGRVKADAGQLEQVLMNLVLNARDAMPRGGRLTIETASVELDEAYARQHIAVQPGPYVLLAVSDTGVGMDAETQAHIFEPFFTTKEKGKGTGLGLATVYGIVKQSGGNIWVYSELGRGTTFKVYLPRVEDEVTAGPAPAPVGQLTGSETVLVVEDEEMVRAFTRESLEAYGYTVLEARDGTDALRIGREHAGPIHLLVTDVVMPGLSGREVAERLAPGRPDMKVLYLSGYTSDAIVHHGVLDAGTAFLQKPFTPDALARKMREVLDVSK